MEPNSVRYQPVNPDVGVYDCEVHLKFRLIEERGALGNREHLLDTLLDAFACGADDYLEPIEVEVSAQEISEVNASPQMRRQLIRLRNSGDVG
ncbi:Npun_R1517 family heterocyst differentiation transcriptional regulator [Thermoleptolyngbya sp.]|jgi:hypothetical protein